MSRRTAQSEPNAFDPTFLTEFDRSDEPIGAAEAETAGPWQVAPLGDEAWGVVAAGANPRSTAPIARFSHREQALLAAAVLPGTGRDPVLRLASRETAAGFVLLGPGGDVEGTFANFDEPLAEALHVVNCLVRSPSSLALLLEAAGAVALREAGRRLRRNAGG